MSEKNNFSNVQRLNSAVMAKYEWTSSLIGMRKSGEEIHNRRTKTYRKANQFLQELLEQRSDGSSLDDNGVIDRYNKFRRNKSNSNDDSHLLNDFNQRLNALNNNRRDQTSKTSKSTDEGSVSIGLQTQNEIENDTKEIIQHQPKPLSKSTMRTILNNTNSDVLSNISPEESETDITLNDDDHQLSFYEESSTSLLNRSVTKTSQELKARQADGEDSPVSPLDHSIIEPSYKPKARSVDSNEDTEDASVLSFNHSTTRTFHKLKTQRTDGSEDAKESPTSSLNHSTAKTLPKPKARQADDTEDPKDSSIPPSNHSTEKTLIKPKTRRADDGEDAKDSSIPPSNHSTEKTLIKPKARRADGSEIIVTSTENPLQHAPTNVLLFKHCHFPRSLTSREPLKTTIVSEIYSPPHPTEQYDNDQLFHLLDEIESECSPANFTSMLDQLTSSLAQTYEINNNIPLTTDDEDEDKENILIIPNLFNHSSLSHDYYTTFTLDIDDPRKISLYTMTIGTVQLSPNLIMPYSIVNGHRPLLQSSVQTNFKQVRSKRQKYTCQVTAVKPSTHTEHLQENDIILKINDQSVWNLTTDAVRNILDKHSKQTNKCTLTIARLCQR